MNPLLTIAPSTWISPSLVERPVLEGLKTVPSHMEIKPVHLVILYTSPILHSGPRKMLSAKRLDSMELFLVSAYPTRMASLQGSGTCNIPRLMKLQVRWRLYKALRLPVAPCDSILRHLVPILGIHRVVAAVAEEEAGEEAEALIEVDVAAAADEALIAEAVEGAAEGQLIAGVSTTSKERR